MHLKLNLIRHAVGWHQCHCAKNSIFSEQNLKRAVNSLFYRMSLTTQTACIRYQRSLLLYDVKKCECTSIETQSPKYCSKSTSQINSFSSLTIWISSWILAGKLYHERCISGRFTLRLFASKSICFLILPPLQQNLIQANEFFMHNRAYTISKWFIRSFSFYARIIMNSSDSDSLNFVGFGKSVFLYYKKHDISFTVERHNDSIYNLTIVI